MKQVGKKAKAKSDDKTPSHKSDGIGRPSVYTPKSEFLPMYLPTILYRWSDGAKEKRIGIFIQLLAGTTSAMYKAKVVEHGNIVVITYNMPSEYAGPKFILSPNNHTDEVYDERTARWIGVVDEIKTSPRKKDDSVTFQMHIHLPFRCNSMMLQPEGRNSYIFDESCVVNIQKRKRIMETMQMCKTMNLELFEYIEENSEDSGMESSEDIGAAANDWVTNKIAETNRIIARKRKNGVISEAANDRPDPSDVDNE